MLITGASNANGGPGAGGGDSGVSLDWVGTATRFAGKHGGCDLFQKQITAGVLRSFGDSLMPKGKECCKSPFLIDSSVEARVIEEEGKALPRHPLGLDINLGRSPRRHVGRRRAKDGRR